MSLQDPAKKMSKSDENPNGSIYLMDDPDTIMRKCKRAVTDSEACVAYRDEQPGVKNLIDIYSACTGKTPAEVVREFEGRGYGDFKMAVGESVISVLKPLQDRVKELEKDKSYIDSVIKNNSEKAQYFANKTLRKVQKKVGFPEENPLNHFLSVENGKWQLVGNVPTTAIFLCALRLLLLYWILRALYRPDSGTSATCRYLLMHFTRRS